MRPATSRERTACFLELASVYPARDGGEAVQQVRFEAYHDALKHLPADILRDACKHCIATQKFFPMPAEILVAAESSFAARAITTSRLKALRDYQLVDPEHYVALSEDERRRRTKMIHAAKTSFADGADVTAILQTENRLSQTVVKLEMEPEVGDLATALLRARVSADGAGHLDMDFAKTVAISDARAMWIYLKARGWRSMEGEAE